MTPGLLEMLARRSRWAWVPLAVGATARLASAQPTSGQRVDGVMIGVPATCSEARTVQFDARLSGSQRATARELLKARAELTALDQALNARGAEWPVIVLRRGSAVRDSLTPAELERELGQARREIDSTLQRVARTRSSSDRLFMFEFDSRAEEVRRVFLRANQLVGSVTADLFGANRRPAGWIGVSIIGEYLPRFTREGPAQWYCSDPVVETVEAGGPAERAGLMRGDTLLTMNGVPMLGHEVRFEAVLQPGVTVLFRTRRNGRTREVPVVVEKRPLSAVASAPLRERSGADSGRFTMTFGNSPARGIGSAGGASGVTITIPPDGGALRDANVTVNVGVGGDMREPAGAQVGTFIGGARFSNMSRDMADALGVTNGVLVSAIGNGSAAAEAGLREGDVIWAVNGTTLRSPIQLLGFARQARTLSLEVVRRGKTKTIEFKF
jgi:membrane-associated protease RseP (regulator of RpoE activity)